MEATTLNGERPVSDIEDRIHQIRHRLPGQCEEERLEQARLHYGPLYTERQIRRQVARTLPWRLGRIRDVEVRPLETYRHLVPGDALLKYDDAARAGMFSRFLVVTPTYVSQPQADPWIVGEITVSGLFAVIARW